MSSGRRPRSGRAAEPHVAGADRGDAHDRVQRRRLAGAVRADQPDDLARRDVERQVAHGVHAAVAHVQRLERRGSSFFGHRRSRRGTRQRRRGSPRISAGAPSASVVPWSSTWMRSQISMISAMLWSISSTPAPWSSRTERTIAANSGISASGSPAAGSSSSTKRGSVASARATPSRRSSPCASADAAAHPRSGRARAVSSSASARSRRLPRRGADAERRRPRRSRGPTACGSRGCAGTCVRARAARAGAATSA